MPQQIDFEPEASAKIDFTPEIDFEPVKTEAVQPQAAPFRGAARGAVEGAGAALKGAGAVAETMPISPEGYGIPGFAWNWNNPDLQKLQEKRFNRTPGELVHDIQANPIYEAGKDVTERAPALVPLTPAQEASKWTGLGRNVGSFVPLVASGPAAPATIGLQSLGEHLDNDFAQAKQSGADDETAAEHALDRGILSGTIQSTIFAAMPPVLRGVLEKYVVDKFGTAAFSRWLAGRASTAAEGATLGASSQAAENVIEGEPALKGTAGAAKGLAALNLLFPWLREKGTSATGEQGTARADGTMVPPAEPQPPAPGSARPQLIDNLLAGARTEPPETPQISAEELLQEMQRNQIAPEPAKEPAPAPEPEPVKPIQFTPEPIGAEKVDQLKLLGLDSQDIDDLLMGRATVADIVERKLPGVGDQTGGGPDHARALDEARLQAHMDIEQILRGTSSAEPVEENKPLPEPTKSPAVLANDVPSEQSAQPDSEAASATVTEPAAGDKRVGRGLRARKIFDRETELNGSDILNWIAENMSMLSKTGAKKKWGQEKFDLNKSLWDDAQPLQRPHHNVIYSPRGSAPDQVAQAAFDARQLNDPSTTALWEAIDRASKARSHVYELQRRHEAILNEEAAQAKRWRAARSTGHVRVDAEELQPGDTMELQGEHLQVTERDPETGDVTLEDGSKFGKQRLAAGDSVYVEKLGDELVDRLNEEPTPYRTEAPQSRDSNTIDNAVMGSVASQYGLSPEQATAALRDRRPYQPELPLQNEADNPGAGRLPAKSTEAAQDRTVSGRLPREALSTLAPGALDKALRRSGKVSSIDPKAAPHDVPQYRVNGTKISTPAEFAQTLVSLRSPYSESLKVVILDNNDVAVHSQVLYSGTLDATVADGRDLMRLMALHGDKGKRLLLSHNHPSGDPTPSVDDIRVTKNIERLAKLAGFEVVDHVITNGEKFYSFNAGQVESLPGAVLAAWEKMPRSELPLLDTDQKLQALVASLRQGNPRVAHIIYVNTRMRVTAIERVRPVVEDIRAALGTNIGLEGAAHVFVDYGPTVSGDTAQTWSDGFNRQLAGTSARIRDWSADGIASAHQAGRLQWKEKTAAPESPDTLRETSPGPNDDAQRMAELKARRDEIIRRLGELDTRRPGGLTDEQKSERYHLTKDSLAVQRELAQNPEYVAELLRKMDALFKQGDLSKKAGNGLGHREALDQAEGIMEGDLAKVQPALLSRIYNELVAKGEIMGSKSGPLPTGRTLSDLINYLKTKQVDSPKLAWRDRFSLARRLADEFYQGKELVQRLGGRAWAAWEAFKAQAQIKGPPIDDDFRSAVKEWSDQKQWTGLETERWIQAIKKKVSSPLRRAGITVWLDAHGDEALLRSQADLVPERYKPVWETALRLTDSEKDVAKMIRTEFAKKLEDGQTVGLIEKGRENYVPLVWRVMPKKVGEYDPTGKRPRTPRQPGAKLDPRDPFFSMPRETPSYFDGIMNGGVPKGLDIADHVGLYNAEFHNALADRGVIKSLKDSKDKEGNPVVMIAGGTHIEPGAGAKRTFFVDSNWRPKEAVTKDGRPYRSLDHWALKDWKFASKDAAGNPIIVHGDFLVHPDFFPFLKNELGTSWLRDPEGGGKYFNWLLDSARFLKASKFASATFHLATIGEHAVFHGVLPLSRGVELDPARNPKLAGLMRHGLDLGFGNQRQMFDDGLASHGGIFSHVPGLGDLMARQSDFLFKRYIPAIKVKAGAAILERNLKRYGGKLSEQQIYELTANQANAAFGIQNWRLLGANKTLLDINRLLFTAPDFLLSRSKVVAQALKPYGQEQRVFLLAQAAFVYTAARALNLLLDDDPHWEPANALNVVYHGRAYAGRFLVNDIFHMVTEPMSFAQGRLGPLPRAGIEAATQRDMRTGARISVPFETNSGIWRSAQILVKDLAMWFVPVGTEGLLPGAAGREQTGLGQVGLALVGVGSHKFTAQNQVYDLAKDFNRQSPDPAAKLYQQRRDAEARGESVYRKLDALLDAGELDQAAAEYRALVAEGVKPLNVAQHFNQVARPFTGAAAREVAFRRSLSESQKGIYERAIQERRDRATAFRQMVQKAGTGATSSEAVLTE